LKQKLEAAYSSQAQEKAEVVATAKSAGPLRFFEDMVPDNIFAALSSNSAMLKVIFFSVLFALALMTIPLEKSTVIKKAVDSLNEIILRMVDFIMYFAPIGVFALISGMITDIAGDDISAVLQLFQALGWYMLTVLAGLFFLIFIVYPLLIFIFNRKKVFLFFKSIFPAQLLAFSTSSSAATLPVTIECVEEGLKVKPTVARFVLPVGATINMDGTSLYQAVATIFIAQVFGSHLTFSDQLTIIITATLASIGSAAVPGAGIIMLVMVLQSVGLSVQGISLIIAVDRILDMFRTVVNITGDSMIACILDRFQGEDEQIEVKQPA
jgi:Na+/H+-dicarboxylate symporter